jgi:hypothetical protein
MKNFDRFMMRSRPNKCSSAVRFVGDFRQRCTGAHFGDFQLQQRAGAHPLQAVDDDAVTRFESGGHDAQTINSAAERDRAVQRATVRADDHHEFLVLIGTDRALVDHHQGLLLRLPHPQSRELPRYEAAVFVLERGPNTDRAALAVNLVVDELDVPLYAGAIGGRHFDRDLIEPAALARGIRDRVQRAQDDFFVRIEAGIDRIDRDQRGQNRG